MDIDPPPPIESPNVPPVLKTTLPDVILTTEMKKLLPNAIPEVTNHPENNIMMTQLISILKPQSLE